jgi:transposase
MLGERPVEQSILRLLRKAALRAEPRTGRMAREILGPGDYLWTFVSNEDAEATNNAAERAIRPAVLWRKGSFATDTAEGSRFAERILAAITTLKHQRRPLLDYLERACRALACDYATPSLLPAAVREWFAER